MEASLIHARAKRGCLWYVGVVTASACVLLVLLVAATITTALNEPSQHSVVVSTDDNTFLEAETSNHGGGFLDGYDWLEIYYVRRDWFGNKRVRVYNFPGETASHVGFHRRVDLDGQVRIEVLRPGDRGKIYAEVYQRLARQMKLDHSGEAYPLDQSVYDALNERVRTEAAALEKANPIDWGGAGHLCATCLFS